MTNHLKFIVFSMLPLALAAVTVDSNTLHAQLTVDEIRDQFAAHNVELDQIFVQWEETAGSLPLDSEEGQTTKRKCRVAVKGDKRLFEIHYTSVAGPPVPEGHEHKALMYDGQETKILMLSDHARVWSGNETDRFDAPDQFLALQGYPKSNYRVPHRRASGEWTRVSCDIEELLEDVDVRLTGTEEIGGARCVRVSTSTSRFYFDPSRGFALLQREFLDSQTGNVIDRHSFRDLMEVQPGLWLARTILRETIVDGQPDSRAHLTVLALNVDDVPDELFALEFDSGTMVSDLRHFVRNAKGHLPIVNYRIPSAPEDLDAVAARALALERSNNMLSAQRQARSNMLLAWSIIVCAMLSAFLVGVIIWRRRASHT